MPAILAFEKISKRFGAVVVARALDLVLATPSPTVPRLRGRVRAEFAAR